MAYRPPCSIVIMGSFTIRQSHICWSDASMPSLPHETPNDNAKSDLFTATKCFRVALSSGHHRYMAILSHRKFLLKIPPAFFFLIREHYNQSCYKLDRCEALQAKQSLVVPSPVLDFCHFIFKRSRPRAHQHLIQHLVRVMPFPQPPSTSSRHEPP